MAPIRRIRVAPDGSFLAAASPDADTATLVRGQLAHGNVTGSADLSVGTCTGTQRFTARR